MKLSTKGRYGLRMMIVLASHYEEGPISVKYISKREGISEDYIEQLFIKLKRCGLVKSVRGPEGGFVLAKPPSKIRAGDIMRCVGEGITLAPCIGEEVARQDYPLWDRCIAKVFFKEVTDRLEEMMDSTSLTDICKE